MLDRENMFWITFCVVMAFLTAFLILLIVLPAHGHEAPGYKPWTYPPDCCSPDDTSQLCHPIPCEEISQDSVGNYLWGGLLFRPEQIHPTQDETCHACNSKVDGKPTKGYCLFIRNTT